MAEPIDLAAGAEANQPPSEDLGGRLDRIDLTHRSVLARFARNPDLARSAREFVLEAKVAASFLVVFFVFVGLVGRTFLTAETWGAILNAGAELGIVSIGVALLMLAGEFDLSVGANLALAGMCVGLLLNDHVQPLLALLAGLGIGAGIGASNGIITIVFGIPSFITTLGTWLFWSAVLLIVNGGLPVSFFGSSRLMTVLAGSIGSTAFRWEDLWWFGIAVVATVLAQRTRWGNWLYATGGARQSADALGIRTVRVRLSAFVICGVLSSFAGIVELSHLQSMAPDNGADLQLDAIAAAVIGGTALSGGIGRIAGVFIGTVLLSMLSSALVLARASTLYYEMFVGIIVIAAVAIHRNTRWPTWIGRTRPGAR